MDFSHQLDCVGSIWQGRGQWLICSHKFVLPSPKARLPLHPHQNSTAAAAAAIAAAACSWCFQRSASIRLSVHQFIHPSIHAFAFYCVGGACSLGDSRSVAALLHSPWSTNKQAVRRMTTALLKHCRLPRWQWLACFVPNRMRFNKPVGKRYDVVSQYDRVYQWSEVV